jgi:hypothetical protein
MPDNRISGPLSYVSCYIELEKRIAGEPVALATATGFLWLNDGDTYLITNLHNLAGWDYGRSKALDKDGAVPSHVRISVRIQVDKKGGVVSTKMAALLQDLYDPDSEPLWLVHPAHDVGVDVAAISLGKISIASHWPEVTSEHAKVLSMPLNGWDQFADFDIDAGDDAYVIGYPLGLHGGGRFPIWKRASIASEPGLLIDDLPKVLIDTATRKGMSGSPVIAVRRGYIRSRDGDMNKDILGQAEAFLGVYSGRVDDDPLGAHLGIVWKAEVIDEIIKGGVRAKTPWS